MRMLSRSIPSTLPAFWVVRSADAREVRLHLHGELDIATSHELARELRAALLRADGRSVLVDLAPLDFMDCSALHILLELADVYAEANVALRLRRGGRAVHRLFELTRTEQRFDFDP
jgi:anti-anti-sigma factor